MSGIRLSLANELKPTEAPGQKPAQVQSAGERFGTNRPVAHVLLVAGVRAAGKSTFLDQLMCSGLPEELAAHIPAGADRWPQYLAGYHLLWRPMLWSGARQHRLLRLVPRRLRPAADDLSFALHYDLTRFAQAGIKDPALAVVRSARRLTVVTVRAPPDQLIGQYERRRLQRLAGLDAGKRTPRTTALYLAEGWVDNLYNDWSVAVAAEFAPQTATHWLEIEPVANGPRKDWHIRRKADMSSQIRR